MAPNDTNNTNNNNNNNDDDDDNKKIRRRNPFRQRSRLFQKILSLLVVILVLTNLRFIQDIFKVLHEVWDFNQDACPASLRRGEDRKICFVSSVFGEKRPGSDRPADVRHLLDCSKYRFFFFSNLFRLQAPGWTKLLRYDLAKHYSRVITQSRWPKFLAWQDVRILNSCRVVFYMDGYVQPRLPEQMEEFERIAKELSLTTMTNNNNNNNDNDNEASPPGLAQVLHPMFNGETFEELFQGILLRRKDIPENTNVTYKWLQAQSDYQSRLPYYLNKYFAYNPHSPTFQKISTFFWEQYSNEKGSWRDQPMWAYTLHHFNVTPLVLTKEGDIEKGGNLFKHGGSMGWGGHVYKD